MDLLDRLRVARETERLALIPRPGFTDAAGLGGGIGSEGARIGVAVENEIAVMIKGADDADLLRAYQCTDKEPGDPEADALLAEIERRGLDV